MNKYCLKYLLLPWMENIPNKNILHLKIDSRELKKGDLFIAIPGIKHDGRNFISEAIKKKVAAILCETQKMEKHASFRYINSILIIYFFQLSKNVSQLAIRFYQEPAKKLKIVGVTGTNGKTTVTQLINQWNNILGNASATMGTLGNGVYNSLYHTKNTTSSAIFIQSFLSTVLEKKIELVTMEISSHGLIQNRVKGIPFYIAIFTNLTQDHLDYHNNMEEYEKAKWLLFSEYNVKKMILNADDKHGKIWLKKLANYYTIAVTIQDSKQKKYATKWINATNIKHNNNLIYIKFESSWGQGQLSSRLIGRFNIINLLLSLACLLELDYKLSDLVKTSIQIKPVNGRMQTFSDHQKPLFIIDYAHNPDAFKQTLSAIRLHYHRKYLWCIFGCGGERDKKKRSIMGKIAEKIADKVIITNDNPRNEEEMKIIHDILQGCKKKKKILVIKNRKKAIYYAFLKSKHDHIIFIAGKGHEEQQIIGNKNFQYSDKKTVLRLLEKNL